MPLVEDKAAKGYMIHKMANGNIEYPKMKGYRACKARRGPKGQSLEGTANDAKLKNQSITAPKKMAISSQTAYHISADRLLLVSSTPHGCRSRVSCPYRAP